jgi:hypothetical protein
MKFGHERHALRRGTVLSSCASARSGAAVTSKKDRHPITPGGLPRMALSRKCAARIT